MSPIDTHIVLSLRHYLELTFDIVDAVDKRWKRSKWKNMNLKSFHKTISMYLVTLNILWYYMIKLVNNSCTKLDYVPVSIVHIIQISNLRSNKWSASKGERSRPMQPWKSLPAIYSLYSARTSLGACTPVGSWWLSVIRTKVLPLLILKLNYNILQIQPWTG